MDLRIQSGIRLCHIDFIKILMILILMGMFPSGSVIAGYLTLPITGDFPITYSFEDPKYQRHKGTDYGTPTGSDIIAPYKGTVIDTSPIDTDIPNSPGSRSYGNFIKIDHGLIDGKRVYTIYGHLLYGSFLVKKGSKVLQGQQLAKSGNSGDSTGPHLHFEVRVDGKAKDPYDTNAYLWTKNPPSHSVYIPARCLIQLEGDGTVYWLQNEKKYPISVPAIIDTMENAGIENWGWGKIITVFDVSKYATGPNVLTSTSASDNLLIKDIATNRIYKMKDGVKEYQSTLTNFADVIDMASDFFNITAHESYMVGQLAPNAIIKQEFVNIYDLNVSELGLPTDVVKQTESITGEKGFYQTFDNGSIQYTASGVNAGSGFAVYGKIYNKWALLRYADSPLGLPIDNQTTTFTSSQGTTGFYQSFERGSIQVNINNNQEYAYAVYDEIYNKWGQLNFAAGDLGLPVGDIINHARSGFGTLGYYQRFENGTIQVVNNSVYAVDGIIYREWGNQGYAGKSLPGNDIEVNQTTWAGFPISDPYTWNGNLRQNFEGGYIVSDGTAAEFISDKHPNNLTASKISSNTIHLAWENRINTDWVNIYRFSSPAELIDTVAGDITSYDDTILTDHAYTYYLQAANETSESPPSNLFSVNVSKTTVILSYHSPDLIIAVGSNKQVYGTSASNQVTLESGAKAEMINFPGHNIINIQSSSDLFSVSRSGTVVTFQGSDGTLLKIPATTDIQTISFNGEESRVLQMYNNLVMLDDQVITTTAAAIEGQKEQAACGAYIAPGVWKEFDCYNLAAIGKTTGDDPFTPSWSLIGGYWQWGRKGPDPSQWYNTNTEHFAHGPKGPGESEANAGEITGWTGWNSSDAPSGAWSDSHKTANDPCPAGLRVPTISQWEGVITNNTQSIVGTWTESVTNYSAARFFGDTLMLPAAGMHLDIGGDLLYRGLSSYYWSSSEYSSRHGAWYLYFHGGQAKAGFLNRQGGCSIRCVADDLLQSQTLSLKKNTLSLNFGNSEIISIIGGSGYFTVGSNNSQVATAVISGSSVEVTGLSPGTATITVEDTGGESASITVTVTTTASGDCGAYVAPGVWKEFDCYNLAAIGKTTNDDPFIPSWRLIGGYWQWGRKGPDHSQWYDSNTPNFAHGPTGPGSGEANDGAVTGWDLSFAPDGSWSDASKTVNDPCPFGYRVPTRTQWDGVRANNTQSIVGSWSTTSTNHTNYSAARFFGNDLMLPASGYRYYYYGSGGVLTYRGYKGHYWSSTSLQDSSTNAWNLYFLSSDAGTNYLNGRHNGMSVRCVPE